MGITKTNVASAKTWRDVESEHPRTRGKGEEARARCADAGSRHHAEKMREDYVRRSVVDRKMAALLEIYEAGEKTARIGFEAVALWARVEGIAALGALPVFLVLMNFGALLEGARALFLCGNKSGDYSFVRGTSGDAIVDALVAVSSELMQQLNICPWPQYVASSDNLADEPSRNVSREQGRKYSCALGCEFVESVNVPPKEKVREIYGSIMSIEEVRSGRNASLRKASREQKREQTGNNGTEGARARCRQKK